jgi:L-histidine Nalpha-methyltransferase
MAESDFVHRLLSSAVDSEDWAVIVALGDPAEQLAQVTHDLQLPYSTNGDGKHFMTGFAYMNTESTLAWARASNDLYYPVMKAGIETFSRRWANVRTGLGEVPHHYVSLGPGTGQKDDLILRDLERRSQALCYWAIDMSADMLRLAVRQVLLNSTLPRNRIASLQLDFSRPDNLERLRVLIHSIVGEEPVLYSLLGNTIANFADDEGVLMDIARLLLRPQDRLLLEIATTRTLGQKAAEMAAAEYAGTRAFREFVTSALLHYTDLTIEENGVLFEGSIEGNRALLIKAIYRNQTGHNITLTLPDRSRTAFPATDTIRLNVTRKYALEATSKLITGCGMEILAGNHWDLNGDRPDPIFGMDILLLQQRPAAAGQDVMNRVGVADAIWRKGAA